MGSITIESMRKDYPGKTDHQAAELLAQKDRLFAIVRYKAVAGGDYSNVGLCFTSNEIATYFTSSACYAPEIIYDARKDPRGLREIACPVCEQIIVVPSSSDFAGRHELCGTEINVRSGRVVGYKEPLIRSEEWIQGAVELGDDRVQARRHVASGLVEVLISSLGGWTSVHPRVANTFSKTNQNFKALMDPPKRQTSKLPGIAIPTLCTRFDVNKMEQLGSAFYGRDAWKVFWRSIDVTRLMSLSNLHLYDGDSNQTLCRQENVFCIAVQSIDPTLLSSIRHDIAQNPEYLKIYSEPMFLLDDQARGEPLVNAGILDAGGHIVGGDEANLPRKALEAVINARSTSNSDQDKKHARRLVQKEDERDDFTDSWGYKLGRLYVRLFKRRR